MDRGQAGQEAYEQAWLDYRRIEDEMLRTKYAAVCGRLVVVGDGAELASARLELRRAIGGLLGMAPVDGSAAAPAEAGAYAGEGGMGGAAIVVGLADAAEINLSEDADMLKEEGYAILSGADGSVYLLGGDAKGALYAAFGFIRLLCMGRDISDLHIVERPAYSLRMIDQ